MGSTSAAEPWLCLPSPQRVILRAPRSTGGWTRRAGDVASWSPALASPHSGLVHQVLPLAVILHVRVVGGEHGVEGEDLLLDGAAICHLQQSTEVGTGKHSPVLATPLSSGSSGLPGPWRCRGQVTHWPAAPGKAANGGCHSHLGDLPGHPHFADV